jgi:hypothetical protein
MLLFSDQVLPSANFDAILTQSLYLCHHHASSSCCTSQRSWNMTTAASSRSRSRYEIRALFLSEENLPAVRMHLLALLDLEPPNLISRTHFSPALLLCTSERASEQVSGPSQGSPETGTKTSLVLSERRKGKRIALATRHRRAVLFLCMG